MAYRVVRSRQSRRDLTLIFDHLAESYEALGDSRSEALDRAAARLRRIGAEMKELAKAPHQGTLRSELMPGLRNVTKDKVVFYFVVDDEAEEIRVLSIFMSGQDHLKHMLVRLLNDGQP